MATQSKRPKKAVAPKPAGRRNAVGLRIASSRLPRHGAFFFALALGVLMFAVTIWLLPAFAIAFGAITTFVAYLAMVALMLPILTPDFLRSRADEADTPSPFIFATVIGIVGVCCVTLFMALNGGEEGPLLQEVLLSVASVLLGWFTIHTMAALHYAYEYYESPSANPGGKSGQLIGGLDFPEGDSPDGIAFLYFAYVIGTAFAVSDIRVTSNKMRKLVLMHSTFSYFFNTLIVAATVNVAVAVGNI